MSDRTIRVLRMLQMLVKLKGGSQADHIQRPPAFGGQKRWLSRPPVNRRPLLPFRRRPCSIQLEQFRASNLGGALPPN